MSGNEAAEGLLASPKLTLNILEEIKAAQLQNGLRHGNYQRYRQYCARRLRRFRKSLKFTHGKGRKFAQRELNAEDVATEQFLFLPMMNAERAWSYAMERKQDLEESAETTRPHFHALRRLSKAAQWARQLRDLCQQVADDRTCLEAEAYCAWMDANVLLEREQWAVAYEKFRTAETVYARLSAVGTMAQQELFAERIKEIAPSLRYCKYNMAREGGKTSTDELVALKASMGGMGQAQLQSKLEAVLAETRQEMASSMSSVSYRGHVLPLESEKLRLALARGSELEAELDKTEADDIGTRSELYSSLLSTYDEAQRLVSMDAQRLARTATASHTEQAELLEMHVRELRLRHQVDRTLLLLRDTLRSYRGVVVDDSAAVALLTVWSGEAAQAAKERAEESRTQRGAELLCNLATLLLQATDAFLGLRAVREDKVAAAHVSAASTAFQGMRAVFAAEAYASQGKWTSAHQLLGHAAETLDGVAQDCQALELEPGKRSLAFSAVTATPEWLGSTVNSLAACARGGRSLVAARAHLASHPEHDVMQRVADALDGSTDTAGLASRGILADGEHFRVAHTADGVPCVEPLPTLPQPVPAKPALFDLALDHVEFPGAPRAPLDPGSDEGASGSAGEQAGGWLSWLRR